MGSISDTNLLFMRFSRLFLQRAYDLEPPASRLHQRLKRVYVLCQLPNSGGRSRQGDPVRAIQSTPSTNCRLFAAVTPQLPTLPVSIASIFAH